MKKLFLVLVASMSLHACAPALKVVFKEVVGLLGGKAGLAVGEAAGRVAGTAMKASDFSEASGEIGERLGTLIGELSGELAWNFAGSLTSPASARDSGPNLGSKAEAASFTLDRVVEEGRSVAAARTLKILEYYQLFEKGREVGAGGEAREYRIEYAYRVTDRLDKRGILESLRFSARSGDGVLSPLYSGGGLEFSYGDGFRLAGGLEGLPPDLAAVMSLLLDCDGDEDGLFANTKDRPWLPGERGPIDRKHLASSGDFASIGVDPEMIVGELLYEGNRDGRKSVSTFIKVLDIPGSENERFAASFDTLVGSKFLLGAGKDRARSDLVLYKFHARGKEAAGYGKYTAEGLRLLLLLDES